jgi:hypothetical protein
MPTSAYPATKPFSPTFFQMNGKSYIVGSTATTRQMRQWDTDQEKFSIIPQTDNYPNMTG